MLSLSTVEVGCSITFSHFDNKSVWHCFQFFFELVLLSSHVSERTWIIDFEPLDKYNRCRLIWAFTVHICDLAIQRTHTAPPRKLHFPTNLLLSQQALAADLVWRKGGKKMKAFRCLRKAANLSAPPWVCEVCWHKRCVITTEEEPVLSQDLAIWSLREPAFISESASKPGLRDRKISEERQKQPQPNPNYIISSFLFSFILFRHCCDRCEVPGRVFPV